MHLEDVIEYLRPRARWSGRQLGKTSAVVQLHFASNKSCTNALFAGERAKWGLVMVS